MRLILFLFLLASCFSQQPYSNLQQISTSERPLVSASLYDYSKFDNSQNIIPLDDSLNSLSNIEDKLVMGLYKKYSNFLQSYRFDPPNFQLRKTHIIINPCASLKFLDKCKEEIAINVTKQLRVSPLDDILVMLQIEDFLFDCNNNYATIQLCGTFFEIHRPLDEKIIYSKRLNVISPESAIFEYLTIKDLCAGKYEIWLVFRSQIGSIIHFIKPFFVEGPSCSCDVIQNNGFSC